MLHVLYILYSYNKVSQRKNDIKKITRKIHLLYLLKSSHNWTHTVQTHIIQGSTILSFMASNMTKEKMFV